MRRTLFSILFLLLSVSVWGQELTLQGRVIDAETGEPLPYASIYVDAGRGTLTNTEGDFRLTVSGQNILLVSYVGYEKQRVKASEVSGTIRLMPFKQQLKEVVVVPIDKWNILKQVIRNLKKDYSSHKADRQGYFMRTLMRNSADSYLIESLMGANSAVNLRDEETFSGIYGKNAVGDSSRMGLDFTNIQHMTEIAPHTISCSYWREAIKPLGSVATAKKYYDVEVETLFGGEGEKLYRIHFQWKKSSKGKKETGDELSMVPGNRRYLTGTAFVDAGTMRLLRFEGEVGNAYLTYNFFFRQPNAIKFHIGYDYTHNFAAVNNLAIEGGNVKMQYRILMFGIQADSLVTAGGGFVDNNILNAVKNAGYDSTLWDKYDIVKRTEEEERVAFGDDFTSALPMPEQNEEPALGIEEKDSLPTKSEKKASHLVKRMEGGAFHPLMERLAAFAGTIPQEKVFVHMDNTSYQLGDTIWFTAYTRQTNTGRPSDVSGVLYVELYGQEGYMIERKLIQMKEGRGSGFFALTNQIQYAGFYELRAYTRWQLNWGLFEHKHTDKLYFATKRQEKEYYRDYEKLYSRVFPVYDKPTEAGEFNHDMTLRAMRRLYNTEPDKSELRLSLYPEGGNLVEGQPCRIAFEAVWNNGEWAEGKLIYGSNSAKVQNRGRGLFEVIPQKGIAQEVRFVAKDGQTTKAELPKAEQTGVSLRMKQDENGWSAYFHNTDNLPVDSLALSLMHEGRLVDCCAMTELPAEGKGYLYNINDSLLAEAGVYQLTVFDTQGRVFADRLFFARGEEGLGPTLSIEGLKEEYRPYEKVELKIKRAETLPIEGKGWRGSLSLSVRDDMRRDFLYDDGNILTEMLLSSEIRGFVPQPGWYFEKDDQEHRQALDLLMMTQGWRRFDWRSMAVRGTWDLVQPAEKAPILMGNTFFRIDDIYNDEVDIEQGNDLYNNTEDDKQSDLNEERSSKSAERRARDEREYKRAVNEEEQNKMDRKELKVHAEIVAVDAETSFTGEVKTNSGAFRIQLPPFYGPSVLFISVADTTKWKKDKPYTWIQAEPDDEETDYMYLPANRKLRQKIFVEPADYLGRICWPYPRFVKPYSFYQNHLAPSLSNKETENGQWTKVNGETLMREVTVKAKRNSLRKFDDTWPILAIDALEANNIAMDYGLGFMQIMVGDYGVGAPNNNGGIRGEPTFETRYGYGRTRRMLMDKEIPADSIYARKYLISGSFEITTTQTHGGSDEHFYLSPGESMEYRGTGVWDKYVLYSDYSPRMEGNKQYYGSGEPKTKLVMYPFPDGSRRITYRDRRYILEGFAYPAEFYSPDYSKMELTEGKKDYRRTLYWNPNLKLDANGEANITFYNNSRQSNLSVEAEGQSSDGTLLWSK